MTPFQILADPVRYRIVEILASGRHSAGELAAAAGGELALSRSAISHQLRTLRDAGAVRVEPEGAVRLYRLDPRFLARLDAEIDHLRDLWDRRTGWPAPADPLAHPPQPVPRPQHRIAERLPRARRRFDLDAVRASAPDDPWEGLWEEEPRERGEEMWDMT